MTKKKGYSVLKVIMELILILPNVISFVSNLTKLISYEARLAAKSIFVIIILSLICTSLLSISWLCLLCLLYIYLLTYLSTAISLLIVFFVNTIILLFFGLLLLHTKKNLEFTETRENICAMMQRD